jgi:hypothetical protein
MRPPAAGFGAVAVPFAPDDDGLVGEELLFSQYATENSWNADKTWVDGNIVAAWAMGYDFLWNLRWVVG